eukprot:8712502-Alexandrium_andersonii.AAC.1
MLPRERVCQGVRNTTGAPEPSNAIHLQCATKCIFHGISAKLRGGGCALLQYCKRSHIVGTAGHGRAVD